MCIIVDWHPYSPNLRHGNNSPIRVSSTALVFVWCSLQRKTTLNNINVGNSKNKDGNSNIKVGKSNFEVKNSKIKAGNSKFKFGILKKKYNAALIPSIVGNSRFYFSIKEWSRENDNNKFSRCCYTWIYRTYCITSYSYWPPVRYGEEYNNMHGSLDVISIVFYLYFYSIFTRHWCTLCYT